MVQQPLFGTDAEQLRRRKLAVAAYWLALIRSQLPS
jgi:hypothetical protein